MGIIKKIFAKIIARKISKQIKLEDKTMAELAKDGKPWYKSKGVITGIVTVLIGLYESLKLYVGPQVGWDLPEIPAFVFSLLGALGIYARTVAKETIK